MMLMLQARKWSELLLTWPRTCLQSSSYNHALKYIGSSTEVLTKQFLPAESKQHVVQILQPGISYNNSCVTKLEAEPWGKVCGSWSRRRGQRAPHHMAWWIENVQGDLCSSFCGPVFDLCVYALTHDMKMHIRTSVCSWFLHYISMSSWIIVTKHATYESTTSKWTSKRNYRSRQFACMNVFA